MSYAEDISAARRLAILLALYFTTGYTLNRVTLRQQVERTGYITGADMMATECAWLAEMHLVEQLDLDVVRLTVRGEDVALGRSETPGVQRPSPGASHGTRW
jgi:hypothetical protein